MKHPILYLKTKKDQSLRRFHPWVFSGAIKKMDGQPINGGIVEVRSNHGEFLGLGHYAEGSIAVRIFSFEQVEPETNFWTDKLRAAYQLREAIGLAESEETTMYRLVHAEGDGLSGLIIDWYNGVAVIQAHSLGMYQHMDAWVDALKSLYGFRLKAVYDKSAATLKKSGGISEDGYVWGERPDNFLSSEHGILFSADWEGGQKTGFFIDQRESRKLLGEYAHGKSVLNTFCYTGGFSLYAMKHGAKEVHSLDSSARALDLVQQNIDINGFEEYSHQCIKADAVEYIKEIGHEYDIVVLDPPAFAKHKSAKHQAVQGYKRINAHAIRQIKSGGIIFTFSCSQAIDKSLFNHTITAAAISAGRKVKILHQLHQAADHPVNIFHPEGEYLKGLVLRVD